MYANINAAPTMGANVNAPPMGISPYYTSPGYCYSAPVRTGDTFVLIVVLFILLIIVGCYYFPKC